MNAEIETPKVLKMCIRDRIKTYNCKSQYIIEYLSFQFVTFVIFFTNIVSNISFQMNKYDYNKDKRMGELYVNKCSNVRNSQTLITISTNNI